MQLQIKNYTLSEQATLKYDLSNIEEVIDEIRETIYKDVPTSKDVTALYNKTKNGALKVGASEQQATYEAQLAVYNYHQGFSDGINERNKLISKLSKIVGLS